MRHLGRFLRGEEGPFFYVETEEGQCWNTIWKWIRRHRGEFFRVKGNDGLLRVVTTVGLKNGMRTTGAEVAMMLAMEADRLVFLAGNRAQPFSASRKWSLGESRHFREIRARRENHG